MNGINKEVAQKLLKVKAIKLQPQNPFTWASGWTSPIYCDNRKTLSYPEVRNFIKSQLARLVKEKYPEAGAIAGVATGAIALGVLVAEEMGLPFVYVRSKAKEHGRQNQVEGYLESGQNVVVVEDLISTGGSSLSAVEALKDAGAKVLGMLGIFTYDFQISQNNFNNANVELTTLSDYHYLLEQAAKTGYVSERDLGLLKSWRENPSDWGK